MPALIKLNSRRAAKQKAKQRLQSSTLHHIYIPKFPEASGWNQGIDPKDAPTYNKDTGSTNHMKLKKQEDQSIDASVPLRSRNKILTGGRGLKGLEKKRGTGVKGGQGSGIGGVEDDI